MTQKAVYASYWAPDDGVRDNVCNPVIETASILEHGCVRVLFAADKMARLNKAQRTGHGLSGMDCRKPFGCQQIAPKAKQWILVGMQRRPRCPVVPDYGTGRHGNLQKTSSNFFSIIIS